MIKRFTNYVKNEDSEEEVFFSVPKKEVNQPEIEIKEKPDEKKEKKEEPIKYRTYRFCKLCGQKLYSEQDFISHTSSRKHKRNLKSATYLELVECGSMRKFLKYKKIISPLRKSNVTKVRCIVYRRYLRKIFKHLPIH